MKAKYLFRLDDASPFSDSTKWKAIEEIFQRYKILPIVAVIPENKDSDLLHQKYNPNFWNQVRDWDNKGWTIAIHGYQHLFHKVRHLQNIIPFYNRSEFSGLSLLEQQEKIRRAQEIFLKNGLNPKVWVVPGHAFDNNTLQALANETNIKIVSDGISLFPYHKKEFYFLPQQLWSIKKKKFGIWTICLHPDNMSNEEINDLELQLSLQDVYKNILSVKDVAFKKNDKTILDICFSALFYSRFFASRIYRNWNK
jgi:predicted deacetylase